MREPVWISIDVVLAVHDRLLAQHGGSDGLRALSMLESELARQRHLWTYEESPISKLAAAYISGIVRNHPFVDGNKRTGFMTGYVFLARNGQQVIAAEQEVAKVVLQLASGEVDEENISIWLSEHTVAKKKRS